MTDAKSTTPITDKIISDADANPATRMVFLIKHLANQCKSFEREISALGRIYTKADMEAASEIAVAAYKKAATQGSEYVRQSRDTLTPTQALASDAPSPPAVAAAVSERQQNEARYIFLRTNYSRMLIEICCGTFNGQTIEEAEARLDKSIARNRDDEPSQGER